MVKIFKVVLTGIAIILITSSSLFAQSYNLANDWSNTQNPFLGGVWRLYKAPGQLFTSNMNWGNPAADFPAWVEAPYPAIAHVPMWMKTPQTVDNGQMPAGTVMMHGAESSRTGTEYTYVSWMSPSAGEAVISGGAWVSKTNNRPMTWSLRKNGVQFSSGNMFLNDPYIWSNPFTFSLGSGGSSVLRQTVNVGDTLELWIYRTDQSNYANGVGVILQIDLSTQAPPSPTGSGGSGGSGRSGSATSVGYNPQWLIASIAVLILAGGYLLRRRTVRR